MGNETYNRIVTVYGSEHGHPKGAELITAAWVAGEITTDELAGEVIRLIGQDVASNCVPWDIPCFMQLHDYVDANEYLLEVVGLDMSDSGHFLWNSIVDTVDVMLAGRFLTHKEALALCAAYEDYMK